MGEGFRMGNTCTPVAESCQCMAKPIQYCKVISFQLKFKKISQKIPLKCYTEEKKKEREGEERRKEMSGRGDGMSQALEVSVGPAWMTGGSLRSCSLDNFKKRLCLNHQAVRIEHVMPEAG